MAFSKTSHGGVIGRQAIHPTWAARVNRTCFESSRQHLFPGCPKRFAAFEPPCPLFPTEFDPIVSNRARNHILKDVPRETPFSVVCCFESDCIVSNRVRTAVHHVCEKSYADCRFRTSIPLGLLKIQLWAHEPKVARFPACRARPPSHCTRLRVTDGATSGRLRTPNEATSGRPPHLGCALHQRVKIGQSLIAAQ